MLLVNRRINIAAWIPIKTFTKVLILILKKRKIPKRNVGINKIEKEQVITDIANQNPISSSLALILLSEVSKYIFLKANIKKKLDKNTEDLIWLSIKKRVKQIKAKDEKLLFV